MILNAEELRERGYVPLSPRLFEQVLGQAPRSFELALIVTDSYTDFDVAEFQRELEVQA